MRHSTDSTTRANRTRMTPQCLDQQVRDRDALFKLSSKEDVLLGLVGKQEGHVRWILGVLEDVAYDLTHEVTGDKQTTMPPATHAQTSRRSTSLEDSTQPRVRRARWSIEATCRMGVMPVPPAMNPRCVACRVSKMVPLFFSSTEKKPLPRYVITPEEPMDT